MRFFSPRHNFVLPIFIILLYASCSTKISKFAQHNRFVKNLNVHIVNDSLQVHFISPIDITYWRSEESIKKEMRKHHLKVNNEVLFFGTTNQPPYQILVTLGPQSEKATKSQEIIDTLIQGNHFHLIANYIDHKGKLDAQGDLRQIAKSLKVGKHYSDGLGDVMDIVNRGMKNNHFLKTLTEICQFEKPEEPFNSLNIQMQLTFSSFLGPNNHYNKLIIKQEQRFKPKDSLLNIIKSGGVVNDEALNEIVKQASLTNVLMVNENHYYPHHRLLMLDLLPRLKATGYTHLALEALDHPADSILNFPSASPKLSSGFYTMEQNYGNLLREAKRLGFIFVAYENKDQNKDRELGQAENLYNRTIGKDRNAKVVVYAGIDHILERKTASGKKWMANLFKERYHIDPLTVSQTHLNNYRKFSHFRYQLLSSHDLKEINGVAPIDYFLLNNHQASLANWGTNFRYKNKYRQTVQVNLFYQDELKYEYDYHSSIPYFSAAVDAKKAALLPFNVSRKAIMVVYDKLGTVLERKMIN